MSLSEHTIPTPFVRPPVDRTLFCEYDPIKGLVDYSKNWSLYHKVAWWLDHKTYGIRVRLNNLYYKVKWQWQGGGLK